MNDLKHWFQF